MKHIKLFESYEVDMDEYPEDGYGLSSREEQILKELVDDFYLKLNIKKEDGYYYTCISIDFNRFDNFNDLKDYIHFRYLIDKNYYNRFLELLKVTKLYMSFDYNWPIQWASQNGHTEIVKLLLEDPIVDLSDCSNYVIRIASERGHTEIVKLLLEDPRVDPSAENNAAIRWASIKGHIEVVKLLLKDSRVISKLTSQEINKYLNEIS